MAKKSILLVIRWPVGGIRTYLRYVYKGFDPSIWHFTIIAPQVDEMKVLLSEDLDGRDICYVRLAEKPSVSTFTKQVFIELKRKRYDLVHSHGFTSGACVAIPARIFRVTHIMTSHDIINSKQFSGWTGSVKKLFLEYFFGMADVIHSVSHDAQSNLFEYFPKLSKNLNKCIVIQNGIEIERFSAAQPRNFKNELNIKEDVFLIGFLGRFMSQKGFRYLIDAVSRLSLKNNLPKKPLVLTFGDGGFVEREKRLITIMGLERYFKHMPFTSNIAATLKGLDVVAMPSLWEACGLLAMETLVCGTPLIVADCIGLREVVQNTPAKIVSKANSKQLAEELIVEMEKSSKRKFQAFSSEAIKKYDVQQTRDDLLELYKRCICFGK